MKDKYLDSLYSQDNIIEEIERLSDNPVDRVEAMMEVLNYLIESIGVDLLDIEDNWSTQNPTLEQLVRVIIKTDSLYYGVKSTLSLLKDMRDR